MATYRVRMVRTDDYNELSDFYTTVESETEKSAMLEAESFWAPATADYATLIPDFLVTH